MNDLMTDVSQRLWQLSARMAAYLADNFRDDYGFPSREFYGTAFACWLWSYPQFDYPHKISAAFDYLKRLPKPKRGMAKYHWEFVRFALENARRNLIPTTPISVHTILGGEAFAYTRVANWTLLRSTVRLFSSDPFQKWIGHLERRAALLYFQQSDGLIADERGKPSLQYHAFSTALLGLQCHEMGVTDFFSHERFQRALQTLDWLTLPNGECNYWGRGQFQIFGYSAAILAFALGAVRDRCARYLFQAEQITMRLENALRADGSLPLVLGGDEPQHPFAPSNTEKPFLGWYRYNNYFDYLAFTAAFLAKTATILENAANVVLHRTDNQTFANSNVYLQDVRGYRNKNYAAMVTRPLRSLSASLCFPYLSVGNRYPLPVYGGEEYDNFYTAEGLPLPVLLSPQNQVVSLYRYLRFEWMDVNTMQGTGNGIRFQRQILFRENTIEIRDKLHFTRAWQNWQIASARFLVYHTESQQIAPHRVRVEYIEITTDKPIHPEMQLYPSANGFLRAYSSPFEPILPTTWQTTTLRIEIL